MDYEEQLEEIAQDIYERVCELVSPNSEEFEALYDKLYDEAIESLGI